SSAALYRRFAPLRTEGIFRPATALGEVDVVLLRGVGRFSVLRHELVHRLMHPLLPRAPAWLARRLAQSSESTDVDPDAITVGVTAATLATRRLTDSPYRAPLAGLIQTPHPQFLGPQAPGLYSSAFWLATALNSDARYRPRLNLYIRGLAQGLSS